MKVRLGSFLLVCFISVTVTAQVKRLTINPAQTGTGIVMVHEPHVAYIDTAVKPLGKLLLMIVGTGAGADHNVPFFNYAATLGYHVVSLDYKNNVITTVCSNSEDSSCFNRFRQEIVFGEPVSPLVEVDSVNSIYNRFQKLLLYLSKTYAKQGWGQFIKNGLIQWPKITVAGHSQGAGHAAYFGKKFPLDRVLMLAGPQDYLAKYSTPAPWLSGKSTTPVSKYYAFLHVKDPYDFNKQLADDMTVMRSTTPDTLIVQPNTPVATNKHILVVNTATSNPHESMMQPGFEKAWGYLLGSKK
ncbi:MAG: hypothetical protein QM726_11950 [Chitinophagaceae bacterium]